MVILLKKSLHFVAFIERTVWKFLEISREQRKTQQISAPLSGGLRQRRQRRCLTPPPLRGAEICCVFRCSFCTQEVASSNPIQQSKNLSHFSQCYLLWIAFNEASLQPKHSVRCETVGGGVIWVNKFRREMLARRWSGGEAVEVILTYLSKI